MVTPEDFRKFGDQVRDASGGIPIGFKMSANHIEKDLAFALDAGADYIILDGRDDVTLIITGGIRTPADFVKALALGADGVAIANSAIQAIGCVAARICHTNNCPADIATQNKDLRARLNVDQSAAQLTRFLQASTQLMQLLARACGHSHLNQLNLYDIGTWKREMADLAGVAFVGAE